MTAETSNARGLVAKWRGLANEALRRSGTWNGNDLADRIEFMADELEAALSQQPEARGVVDEAMVERAREAYFNAAKVRDGVFTDPVAMRAALTAALTEARNVR